MYITISPCTKTWFTYKKCDKRDKCDKCINIY